MNTYKEGDQLDIVAGLYKKYRTGTYIRACGTKMCAVKVHGDSAQERNLRLSSVRKNNNKFGEDGYIVMTKQQHNELLNEIKVLTEAIHRLELKAKRYGESC